MTMRSINAAITLLALVAGCGGELDDEVTPTEGASAELREVHVGPLTVSAPAPSRPVTTSDGQVHLLYELVLQNSTATPTRLTRIETWAPDRPRAVMTLEGAALASVFEPTDPSLPPGTVVAGGVAAIFLDASKLAGPRLPRALAHRLVLETAGKSRAGVFLGLTVPVIAEPATVLGPPLRGADLVVLNGCCDGAHRRALGLIDGQFFLAQRYAIDFIRVDLAAAAAGEDPTLRGDPARNESYFTFGAPIVAAGPGRIVATRDGVPENVPTQPLPPADIESAPGNYVVEALDDGRFALYAHIKTGAVRVHVGDRVSRGDLLGNVGNTGNSTAPHLHFHVMDRPSPLGADGLPYVFDRFRLQATVDLTMDDASPVPTPEPQARRDCLPRDGDILTFP